jgi:glycine cleavage system aminomethyltransferase T
VNLDFLAPATAAGAIARSPMEGQSRAAGARFELRDGWNVAVEHPTSVDAVVDNVGWADVSHMGKLELQGEAEALDAAAQTQLPFGVAVRRDGAWWCRLTQTRALVVGRQPVLGDAAGVAAVDVTSSFAALTVVGPLARETFARFCAIDLRPRVAQVWALRPGSVGRQPAILIREGELRFLFLFGWATSEYMWSVVADAGTHLGGHPLGVDQLTAFPITEREAEAVDV